MRQLNKAVLRKRGQRIFTSKDGGLILGLARKDWSILVSCFLEHKNMCRGRGRFLNNLCYFLGTQNLDKVQHCPLLSN